VSQWLRRRFGLVIGFIGHLQIVTANNCNTIADLHNLQSLHSNLFILSALVLMDLSHRIYNTLTKSHIPNISVLQHTQSLQITRYIFTDWLLQLWNFLWLSPTQNWLVPEPNEFCHLYSRGTVTHHRKHMKRDHPPLRDVTANTENRSSSIFAGWTMFTELLPGNALIKSVTIYTSFIYWYNRNN
jgi:hypothetical protein